MALACLQLLHRSNNTHTNKHRLSQYLLFSALRYMLFSSLSDTHTYYPVGLRNECGMRRNLNLLWICDFATKRLCLLSRSKPAGVTENGFLSSARARTHGAPSIPSLEVL